MKILQFDSYEKYKATQVEANKLKFANTYAENRELASIADNFRRTVAGASRGLCHGVRNGYEVRALRKLLPGVDVIGTDISTTAEHIPHCIVWDMHDVKPEWVGQVDFIYSNSWDHSYDPYKLFAAWSSCLATSGRLYIPYTDRHSEDGVTEGSGYDAFGCSLDELVGILRRTLIIEDVIDVVPAVTLKSWRKRASYLRAGRIGHFFRAPFASRRVQVIVLRRRPESSPA